MSQHAGGDAIAWRDWDESAFAAARDEGKPVLLTLGATWCHWCHVMDDLAYSDQRVISLVNSRFIPVRVDVDQRPDISLRYNQGGFPSVAFLAGDGRFLAGRPYTPPDEMVALLQQVSAGEIPSAETRPAASPPQGRLAGNPSTGSVLDRLAELYDEEFGGFGFEPKQPPWEALRFLLARFSLSGDRAALAMVERTLQGMWHGIYDRKDQGFFRYSVSRDWKTPHYEKMLVGNASLAIAFLEAYQVTGKRFCREATDGVLNYLLNTLHSSEQGLCFASQDADEPYYRMSWKDREASHLPPIDHTFYAGWNALTAHTLFYASGALGIARYRDMGHAILDKLWRESWTPAGGLAHVAGQAGNAPPALADQVSFLRAWLASYQATGDPVRLARAVEVAAATQRLFGSSEGGCYDTVAPRSFEAAFLPREQPVLDNGHWAEALLALELLTGDSEYGRLAAAALAVFEAVIPGRSYLGSHASRRMEEDEEALFLPAGSAWGRARDMQTSGPVRLVLVGDPSTGQYRRLHRAAQRIYAPHRVVLPLDINRDIDMIRDLGFPPRGEAALYACMGDRCLAPITTPREVRVMARSRPWATL
ncbi:MAG: DUF255 domain-containing protein [Chloroflexota bacterium]|nr:DUF255 domain-containing protein [Chloroflexota bacterium]